MAAFEDISMAMGGLDPTDAPVPGESLTGSPESRAPYEKPPVHTDVQMAVEDLFLRITDPDKLDDTLELMRKDVPIEDIAQVILFAGFREGQWNPDVMLLMMEPTIYMLMYLADYAGIDAVLYPEGDEVEEDEEMVDAKLGQSLVSRGFIPQKLKEEQGSDLDSMPRPKEVTDDLLSRIKEAAEGAKE